MLEMYPWPATREAEAKSVKIPDCFESAICPGLLDEDQSQCFILMRIYRSILVPFIPLAVFYSC